MLTVVRVDQIAADDEKSRFRIHGIDFLDHGSCGFDLRVPSRRQEDRDPPDETECQLRHGRVRRAWEPSRSCPAVGETGLTVGRLHEAEWTLPVLFFLYRRRGETQTCECVPKENQARRSPESNGRKRRCTA